MKDYLKMADVFKVGVSDAGIKVRQNYIVEGVGDSFKPMEYAAHAINSHDELVENVNHYKSEAEMWEGRAVKEASARADMLIERGELMAMNKELLGIINRIIDTSTELEGKDVSSSWSDGYKQCSIDTGKAISEMLGRIEGGEK